jgi:hypothetical protein
MLDTRADEETLKMVVNGGIIGERTDCRTSIPIDRRLVKTWKKLRVGGMAAAVDGMAGGVRISRRRIASQNIREPTKIVSSRTSRIRGRTLGP